MSYEMHHTQGGSRQQVGGKPFNHNQSQQSEQEYDRLRDLARQEASKRGECFHQSQQAYQRGDGSEAKRLSDEGKNHGAKMEQYNKQASEFIFRENNAQGRVADDTIDLHGQFVEEAEDILEDRIKYAQSTGQTHLHVIVGKGNHSPGHIQKIKPRVEQVCNQLGLQYHTEPNEGRIYVNLTGGPVQMHDVNSWGGYNGGGQHQQQQHQQGGYQQGGYQQQQQQQQPYYSQPHGQQQQQHQQQQSYGQNQGQGQNDQVEAMVKKFLPRILNKLRRMLCG